MGTRVRAGAPVAWLSTTSAPRVVTPTMAGGRAVVWLIACALAVLDAAGVADAEFCAAVCPPPPHAATVVSAASAAGAARARSSAGRMVMPPWGWPGQAG
ncbi:MAG TPA: hypothetical protein VIP48_01020 [Streptosporangiaceae bacterium]